MSPKTTALFNLFIVEGKNYTMRAMERRTMARVGKNNPSLDDPLPQLSLKLQNYIGNMNKIVMIPSP